MTPRLCQANGCRERGRAFEIWVTPVLEVGIWFCEEHHRLSVETERLAAEYDDDPDGIAFAPADWSGDGA